SVGATHAGRLDGHGEGGERLVAVECARESTHRPRVPEQLLQLGLVDRAVLGDVGEGTSMAGVGDLVEPRCIWLRATEERGRWLDGDLAGPPFRGQDVEPSAGCGALDADGRRHGGEGDGDALLSRPTKRKGNGEG